MQKPHRIAGIALLVWFSLFFAVSVSSTEIGPPAPGQFIQDLAGIIEPEDAQRIEEYADRLLTEHAIPLIVLTVNSMAEHDGDGLSVESFARLQYETWGHHPSFAYTDSWRRGILLLVAKEDRKARIELGATWPPNYVSQCVDIMEDVLVPTFKRGNYSEGVADGTAALERMSRGEAPESRIPPEWFWLGVLLAIFVAIFLIAHLLDKYDRAGDVVTSFVGWMCSPSYYHGRRGGLVYGASFGGNPRGGYSGGVVGGGYGGFGGFGGGGGGGGGSFGGGGGASGSW